MGCRSFLQVLFCLTTIFYRAVLASAYCRVCKWYKPLMFIYNMIEHTIPNIKKLFTSGRIFCTVPIIYYILDPSTQFFVSFFLTNLCELHSQFLCPVPDVQGMLYIREIFSHYWSDLDICISYHLYNVDAFVFKKLHPSQEASFLQVGAFPVSALFVHCYGAENFLGCILHEGVWTVLCTVPRAVHTPINYNYYICILKFSKSTFLFRNPKSGKLMELVRFFEFCEMMKSSELEV